MAIQNSNFFPKSNVLLFFFPLNFLWKNHTICDQKQFPLLFVLCGLYTWSLIQSQKIPQPLLPPQIDSE